MSDHAAIHELLAKYSSSFDTGDTKGAASVFAKDAVMTISIGDMGEVAKLEGRDAIHGMLKGAAKAQAKGEQRRHHVSGVRISGDGATYTVTSVFLVTRAMGGKMEFLTSGVQTDTVVKSGKGLALSKRALHADVPF
ncbi:MAG: nuclear transport factor 2 family protein [Rhizobiaceae bacterium]|nr:nuclear transport factor 2 family protein [Rhizobiaceae bacterium]